MKFFPDRHRSGRAFEPGEYRNNFRRKRNRRWRPNYGQWKWRMAVNALMKY